MGFESGKLDVKGVSKKEGAAKEKIAALEEKHAALALVFNSLKDEKSQRGDANRELANADARVEKQSQSLQREAVTGPLSDESKSELRAAHGERAEAEEQVEMYSDRSVPEHALEQPINKALIDKLTALDIPLESYSSLEHEGERYLGISGTGLPNKIEAEVRAKMGEIEYQIKEEQLAIPGEKEQMVGDILRNYNLLDEANIPGTESRLSYVNKSTEYQPRVEEVWKDFYPGDATLMYPPPVIEAVTKALVKKSLETKLANRNVSPAVAEMIANDVGVYARMQAERSRISWKKTKELAPGVVLAEEPEMKVLDGNLKMLGEKKLSSTGS